MPSTRLKMPKPMRMLPTRSLRPADVGPAGGTPEDDETQHDEDTPVAPLGTDAQAGGSSTGGEHVARSAAAEDAGTKARAEAQSRTVARTAPCAGCPGAGSHGSSVRHHRGCAHLGTLRGTRRPDPWQGPAEPGPLDPVIDCRCGADQRSAGYPPTSVENLEINTLWDGLFHATT